MLCISHGQYKLLAFATLCGSDSSFLALPNPLRALGCLAPSPLPVVQQAGDEGCLPATPGVGLQPYPQTLSWCSRNVGHSLVHGIAQYWRAGSTSCAAPAGLLHFPVLGYVSQVLCPYVTLVTHTELVKCGLLASQTHGMLP